MTIESKNKFSVTLDHSVTTFPTVLKVDLDDETFTRIETWAGDADILAVNEANNIEFACQLNRHDISATPWEVKQERALYVLLKEAHLPTESVFSLIKKPKSQAVPKDRQYNPWHELPGVYVDHQEENSRVVVSIEGKLFTRYLYSPQVGKPYYYPLIGPHGKTLIQDAPDDHLHHHGLWWGHDDVNGHKLYHEFRGEGRQVHKEFMVMSSGPVFGQITTLINWQDEHGNLLLQETRSIRIYNLPPESRYVDLSTELHAVNGDVKFGDTKEGGFPFLRVNEQINGHHTGVISAANGKVGESEIFGSVTEWVDYSGKLFRSMNRESGTPVKEYAEMGIAMFSHPENDTYASQWFVRDYGPFTPANFHFCGGKVLSSGDVLAMKHRLFIHQGDAAEGKVAQRYKEYAEAAQAKLTFQE
ncbi:PmoA family protein [Paenibacillus aceris]|uniref:Methane oxygenase PmoA n=1 Tax=Paenibacillus aceris TaxID=869555 RepID=A0ABS4I6V9_9BACL|nr:PmoA family protein [Paenibacillus aceris]MBP1966648.1 hypothetical protein [Paenibacillus aceris]NHW38884.1 hypothetical protein [Paenibacillus aceris]